MLLRAFLLALGLVASVSATAHPRDDTLVPGLIAPPPIYANATERQSPVDSRSLNVRQSFCRAGSHPCSDSDCCPNSSYCATVAGQRGCCPNGRVCTLPPIGPPPPPTCIDSGSFVCPNQKYCCPAGSVCTNDGQCQSSSSPPPPPPPPPPPSLDPPPPEGQYRTTSTDAYTSATTTDAYSGVTSTNAYNGATSTDTYNDGTSIHDNPTVPSAYTSPTSTTTTSRSTTSRSSSSFAVANAQTTDGGNGPPTSSAEKTTLGYSITGVMFLVVVAGLV